MTVVSGCGCGGVIEWRYVGMASDGSGAGEECVVDWSQELASLELTMHGQGRGGYRRAKKKQVGGKEEKKMPRMEVRL